ncbi:MAG: glycoside hydrolase family 19 protein [Pseudomonadota bacterium]
MSEVSALRALGAPRGAIEAWQDMRGHLRGFGVNTPHRAAIFMGQCAHESGGFKRLSESMNYSASRLPRIFSKFRGEAGEAAARRYGRHTGQAANQEMIANIAYADKLGNGSPASGDGWRYRGGGWPQLTGRDNYRATGRALDIDLEGFPEIVRTHHVSALISGQFFSANVWRHLGGSDLREDATEATRRVNGTAMLGLEDRIKKTLVAWEALQ